tara:strand:- start:1579 stop:2877 length:1299 start_codon:yes stop_codon:yes gene_type:complete
MIILKDIKFLNDHNHTLKIILFIYLFYIFVIAFCSFLFAYMFSSKFEVMDIHNNIILKNITFEFGELIYNLFNSNGYHHTVNGIKYYLQKLPAVPFLILFLSKISLNYFFILIFKNIIVFSIYFLFSYLLTKDFKNKILFYFILAVPICIPYNFSVALNYVYEDNLIAIFLPILFLSLVSKNKFRFYITSIVLFILYFTKTSMFSIVLIIPIVILIFEKQTSLILRLLPFVTSLSAILIWGYFGFINTGKFPFGSAGASNNAYVLATVFNKQFSNYYPEKSTDLIPKEDLGQTFSSEWDWYKYYDKKNKAYLRNNFPIYLKDCVKKVKFILFGVNRDGSFPDKNGNYDNSLRVSSVIGKIIFNTSIILVLINLFSDIRNRVLVKENLYFVIIIGLNLLPHIIAWATSKHLIASINIAFIYLIIFFFKKKKLI